ncbi:hypothetical protein [Geodermatophilus sp. CPCC 206100]|uniref:hypothetical protein n=1 Tax=Geodermatophilus sp. CPCC 206100 TaxID=3020054 RepID=UPI003B007E02
MLMVEKLLVTAGILVATAVLLFFLASLVLDGRGSGVSGSTTPSTTTTGPVE